MSEKLQPSLPEYAVPGLEKGLDVLELLARNEKGLSHGQIARELGRSPSEVYRVLLCLEARAFTSTSREGQVTLGGRPAYLAARHPLVEALLTSAKPILQELNQRTLQASYIAALASDRVVIVAHENAPETMGLHYKIGTELNLVEDSSGLGILATLPRKEQDDLLRVWSSKAGMPVPADVYAALARITAETPIVQPDRDLDAVMNVTIPVPSLRFGTTALTVPYMQRHGPFPSLESVTGEVRNVARQVSAALG